jgi:hypothetical protein
MGDPRSCTLAIIGPRSNPLHRYAINHHRTKATVVTVFRPGSRARKRLWCELVLC